MVIPISYDNADSLNDNSEIWKLLASIAVDINWQTLVPKYGVLHMACGDFSNSWSMCKSVKE